MTGADTQGPLDRTVPGEEGVFGGSNLRLARLHLRVGWWGLLVFLSLGVGLEGLHGLKIAWYVDVPQETRRLYWTLAHAHGTLLSLVQIAFAVGVSLLPQWSGEKQVLASRCLIGAGVLLPVGFFMAGAFARAGQPGLGILIVPPGALLLFVGVLMTAGGLKSHSVGSGRPVG